MILCNKGCIPCCDFCIHVIHEELEVTPDGSNIIQGGPIACKLHDDETHQKYAKDCYYCQDFHCFNAKEELNNWIKI